jgi:hypothetical protein
MPPAKRATAAKKTTTRRPAAKKTAGPVDQAAEYFASLQDSLAELRKVAEKDTKAAITEIEKLIREGRANLRKVEKRLREEIENRTASKPAARKPAARKPAARKPAARKPAARKPAAKK